MTFYNSKGKAIAYLYDDEYIFLFSGEPVAYLYDKVVYHFDGRHLGWFENEWVRDLDGKCVFFTENTTGGGPAKPARHARPAKSAKFAKPAKYARQARYARSSNSFTWSEFSSEKFFY